MLFKVTFDKEIHILKSINVKTLQELKGMVPKVFKMHPPNFYLTYLDEDGDQITLANETDYSILLGSQAKTAKIIIREKNEDFYDQTQKIEIEEEPKETDKFFEKVGEISEPSEIHSNLQDKSLDESIEEKLKAILPEIISRIKNEVQEEVINQSRMTESKIQQPVLQEPKVVHKHYICDGCQMHGIVGIRYKCAVCNNYDLCSKCEATSDHPHPFLKIKHPSQAPLKIFVILNDNQDSVQMNGQRQPLNGLSNLIETGLNFAQQFMNANSNNHSSKNFQQPNEEQKEKEKTQFKTDCGSTQAKVQKKSESFTERNVSKKLEEKSKVQEKVQSRIESEGIKKDQQQKVIENANYLANILEKNFTMCYKFAEKYPFVSKEQLLELYFQKKGF